MSWRRGPTGGGDDAPTRRRPLWVGSAIVVVVVVVVVPATLTWRRATDPSRRLGPAPTIVGQQCGLGKPPAALLALDGQSGRLLWSRLVGNLDRYQPTGVAVAAGTVVVHGEKGPIWGLSTSDGSHRWCASGGVVAAVDDRMFTIDGRGSTVELDTVSGTATQVSPDVLASLLEAEAGPIAVSGESAGWSQHARNLRAVDRATGETLWSRRVPGYAQITTASMVLVNDQSNGTGQLLSGEEGLPEEGTVTAYRLDTGERAWSERFPWFGGLFLTGERVYLQGWSDRTIRAVDPRTGHLSWAREHDNPGRTVRYRDVGAMTGVATDPATGHVFVLLVSSRPHRD